MKAIQTTGKIDEQGQLSLDYPIEASPKEKLLTPNSGDFGDNEIR
ncbi:hypothetical protein [Dolichospermum sp. LEGE 00240]|nr:hypothetical protein [Dolichospermum sp. LEGE 00240]